MYLTVRLLIALILLPIAVCSQAVTPKTMVGPRNDQIRISVIFTKPSRKTTETHSMTIDIDTDAKTRQEVASFRIDMTYTLEWNSDGETSKEIFSLRWNKSRDVEIECKGKWKKKDPDAMISRVLNVTNAVIKNMPLDTRRLRNVMLPEEVEKKVASILNALENEKLPCQRNVKLK